MSHGSNPFIDRMKKGGHTASHKRAPHQERELAKRFGGRTTPGSGSKHEKGDVRVRDCMRIEAKTTLKKSFRVTMEMIEKIEAAALPCDEIPAMVIEFIDEHGKPLKEVAVVPTYVLEALNGKA